LFEAAHDALIADEATFATMAERNPAAASCIARRLEDALSRGLWTARRNAVSDELSAATRRSAASRKKFMEAAE
jgi:cobalamin biosynthesis Mg chelatase CobN